MTYPNDVRDVLVAEAREHGQSLQAWNRHIIAEVERDLADGGDAGEDAPRAAELLALAREERGGPDQPGTSAAGGDG